MGEKEKSNNPRLPYFILVYSLLHNKVGGERDENCFREKKKYRGLERVCEKINRTKRKTTKNKMSLSGSS